MPVEPGTTPEYAAWLLVAVGLWTLASPFMYAVDGAAFNNTIGVGVVTTALALFVAVSVRRQ
jgi:hypothetical protein